MKRFKVSVLFFLAFLLSPSILTQETPFFPSKKTEINKTIDWRLVDLNNISFPKKLPKSTFPFLWGTATCEYQNSGAQKRGTYQPVNNWTEWESKKDAHGKALHIMTGETSGASTDHWHLYQQDIQLMKDLGLNAYRFSIDWSVIEPEEGKFNEGALKHYEDMCRKLQAANIEPMITLYHVTHPSWFNKKGGFEREENISLFTRFCKKVVQRLSKYVVLWCTINEPTVQVLQGYLRGVFPPGIKWNFSLAGTVFKNLLKAHCHVYKAIKSMPEGKNTQIGIVHQLLKFEPYRWYNPLDQLVSRYFTYLNHDAFMNFFKTGRFKFTSPLGPIFGTTVEYTNFLAPFSLDFIGLNYYSRAIINSLSGEGTCYDGEIMTDMPYAMHPQGLYKGIHEMSRLGVPIYITENGIADAKDDRRELFIKQYLYALSQALKDGYDVRGYFYWTLVDNFEWDMGRSMKFGLYECDLTTQKRTLRKGAECYRDIIKKYTM